MPWSTRVPPFTSGQAPNSVSPLALKCATQKTTPPPQASPIYLPWASSRPRAPHPACGSTLQHPAFSSPTLSGHAAPANTHLDRPAHLQKPEPLEATYTFRPQTQAAPATTPTHQFTRPSPAPGAQHSRIAALCHTRQSCKGWLSRRPRSTAACRTSPPCSVRQRGWHPVRRAYGRTVVRFAGRVAGA